MRLSLRKDGLLRRLVKAIDGAYVGRLYEADDVCAGSDVSYSVKAETCKKAK